MNAYTFHGSKVRLYRAVTLQDALTFVDTRNSAANVTTLSPDCGDQNVSCNEEDFDDQQLNQNQIFEPLGQMEAIAVSDDSDDDNDSDLKRSAPGTKRSASKWKKTSSFVQTIITEDLRENVEE